jgi:hypothetical protein
MLPPSVRIFVASQPVDLRQSFDRLATRCAGGGWRPYAQKAERGRGLA